MYLFINILFYKNGSKEFPFFPFLFITYCAREHISHRVIHMSQVVFHCKLYLLSLQFLTEDFLSSGLSFALPAEDNDFNLNLQINSINFIILLLLLYFKLAIIKVILITHVC